jgi:hypothetical protein
MCHTSFNIQYSEVQWLFLSQATHSGSSPLNLNTRTDPVSKTLCPLRKTKEMEEVHLLVFLVSRFVCGERVVSKLRYCILMR